MVVKIKKQRYKKVCHKRKIKFENYKSCLKATQLEDKIKHLEAKMKLTYLVFKKININIKIKVNKLVIKTQQRFKSEKHNVFTEEINKTASSSNDDKRRQLIDSIETYSVWNEQKSSE